MRRIADDLDRKAGQFCSRIVLCSCWFRRQPGRPNETAAFGTALLAGILLTGCQPGLVPPPGLGPPLDGLVGLLLLLLAGIVIYQWRGSAVKRWRRSDASEGIVRERYARGEISPEEYEKLMQTLSGR
jgi:hypothetical protein